MERVTKIIFCTAKEVREERQQQAKREPEIMQLIRRGEAEQSNEIAAIQHSNIDLEMVLSKDQSLTVRVQGRITTLCPLWVGCIATILNSSLSLLISSPVHSRGSPLSHSDCDAENDERIDNGDHVTFPLQRAFWSKTTYGLDQMRLQLGHSVTLSSANASVLARKQYTASSTAWPALRRSPCEFVMEVTVDWLQYVVGHETSEATWQSSRQFWQRVDAELPNTSFSALIASVDLKSV
ncbi:hypothetical protein BO94DRAFT_574333 [Aspergillus sclerotioniger CBS 115572]|uniref:Uncharacterized protein n=1 Tax=Aspergillus sclerotioniger CBS 115572 TaxID=1450535 RepID=A0A317WW36_9EURO|nr:hypothetical protein BO94DRAFT_574333 [Aspergillus sclerotioniger CBS 115572]PWY90624.1 hypothetical protein BO94DRAFT_574333 [Aspergillus sclerotioniger CBS 115572]